MIPTIEIAEPRSVRLISTAYIVEAALTPLADKDEDLALLTALEGLTSARLSTVARPAGVEASELLTEAAGYGYSYVNAAFCYVKPEGNRFNGSRRGAWYCAIGPDASATARAEIIFHLTRELDSIGVYDNITRYREVLAGFIGLFHDVGSQKGAAYLKADVAIAYPAGQTLADRIFNDGGNGIVYPSTRANGGACLVAFRPHLVQNIRLGATLTFRWNGRRDPDVLV